MTRTDRTCKKWECAYIPRFRCIKYCKEWAGTKKATVFFDTSTFTNDTIDDIRKTCEDYSKGVDMGDVGDLAKVCGSNIVSASGGQTGFGGIAADGNDNTLTARFADGHKNDINAHFIPFYVLLMAIICALLIGVGIIGGILIQKKRYRDQGIVVLVKTQAGNDGHELQDKGKDVDDDQKV